MKTLLKKTILVIALLAFCVSCSKDSDTNQAGNTNNYFIKTKINGTWTEYKIDANATFPLNSNTISGFAKATIDQPFPAFDFEIKDPSGIKTKNYSESQYEMIFRVAKEGTITYHSLHNSDVEDFNIEITEITNDFVKGKFNGTVYLAQGNTGAFFTLTEGTFFLKRQFE